MGKEQWYKTNPVLFELEKKAMKEHYPGAKLGYLKDGRAYWVLNLEVKIEEKIVPYTIMIVYKEEYPKENSCVVFPIKPSMDEIVVKAKNSGKKSVPHTWYDYTVNQYCFDTARRVSSDYDTNVAQSAVWQVAATARWLYYYEIGLVDESIWKIFNGHGSNYY